MKGYRLRIPFSEHGRHKREFCGPHEGTGSKSSPLNRVPRPLWCILENSPAHPRTSALVGQAGSLRRIVNPPPAVRYRAARSLVVRPRPNPVFIAIRERNALVPTGWEASPARSLLT
jgi:hypothetical protein